MRTLNLGILAHVDAGKTSLTERLLYAAGVIGEIGRVDDGNTQTDTLALERRRGITIRSAVVSFVVDDLDGQPDRHAGSPRLHRRGRAGARRPRRLRARHLGRRRRAGPDPRPRCARCSACGVPTLIFVNKIDRAGADPDRTLVGIADRLTPAVVAMGSTRGRRHQARRVRAVRRDRSGLHGRPGRPLAESDETLLAAYVEDGGLTVDRLRRRARASSRTAPSCTRCSSGLRVTGAGVDALMAALTTLLPGRGPDLDAPLCGFGLQGRARPGAARRSPTSACRRGSCRSATGCASGTRTRR